MTFWTRAASHGQSVSMSAVTIALGRRLDAVRTLAFLLLLVVLPLPSASAAPSASEQGGDQRRLSVSTTAVDGSEIPSTINAAWTELSGRPVLQLSGRNVSTTSTVVRASALVDVVRTGKRFVTCVRSHNDFTTTDPSAAGSWKIRYVVLRHGSVVLRTAPGETPYFTTVPVVLTMTENHRAEDRSSYRLQQGDEVRLKVVIRLEGGFDPFSQTLSAGPGRCPTSHSS